MQTFQLFIFISIALFSCFEELRLVIAASPPISKTIYVTPSGRGDFTKIQEAIDKGVPENNTKWIKIYLVAAIYWETVIIPKTKPYIILEGQSRTGTVINCNTSVNLWNGTINVEADNFVAKRITFKNSFNQNNIQKPAVAAVIQGDKNSFYNCAFVSLQDTLYDALGRHFFYNCYIEGFVDFIMGNGQSVYQQCELSVKAGTRGGYITAQHRNSEDEPTGFVFKMCNVIGTGPSYLGRAWGPYSRVIFYKSLLTGIVHPLGWSAWDYQGQEKNIFYAEVGCTGAGSNTSKRVNWERKLSWAEIKHFIGSSFINHDGWIENQPVE